MNFLLFILVGICMGLTAGLFGIGGGMFAVPFMVIIFEHANYVTTPIPQTAVLTAMAITSFTTFIAAITHWQLHKQIMLQTIKKIASGLMLGSVLGTLTLVNISGEIVKLFVGLLLLWVGVSFLSPPARDTTRYMQKIPLPFGGVIIGGLSSIFGIAGGLLTVPLLKGHGLTIKQAIAIASGTGFIVSSTAVSASVVISSLASQPPFQYVHAFAFFMLVSSGSLVSYLAARYRHKMDHESLKRFFAIFLLCLSTYLITNAALSIYGYS